MRQVVVAGTQQILSLCIEHLLQCPDVRVPVVYTSKAEETPIRNLAAARGYSFIVKTNNIKTDISYLSALRPDLLLSFQYHCLIETRVLEIFQGRCFNLHFSLLPKYAGCYPITWAILNGESETGVTFHVMTSSFDDGDIIAQKRVAVSPNLTAGELYDAQTEAAAQLFTEALPSLLENEIASTKQDGKRFTYYKKNSIDWASDRFVVWERDINQVHNQIRAFTFPKFQLPKTYLNNIEMCIEGSEIADKQLLNEAQFRTLLKSEQCDSFGENQVVGLYKNKAVVWKGGKVLLIDKLQNVDASQFLAQSKLNLSAAYFHSNIREGVRC